MEKFALVIILIEMALIFINLYWAIMVSPIVALVALTSLIVKWGD